MTRRLNSLKALNFSLIEIIIMAFGYGISIYCTFTYWEPVWKSFLVLAVAVLPIMLIIWSSASKYVKAYEDVLVSYSILLAIIFSMSTLILGFRHETLYYTTTLALPALYFTVVACFTSDVYLNKDLEMMRDMIYYAREYLNMLYFLLIFVGIAWKPNTKLVLTMGATYFVTRAGFFAYVRYYINVRTKKAKNNK